MPRNRRFAPDSGEVSANVRSIITSSRSGMGRQDSATASPNMPARSAVTGGNSVRGGVRTGVECSRPEGSVTIATTSCQCGTPRGAPGSNSSVPVVMPRLRSRRPFGAAGSSSTRDTW